GCPLQRHEATYRAFQASAGMRYVVADFEAGEDVDSSEELEASFDLRRLRPRELAGHDPGEVREFTAVDPQPRVDDEGLIEGRIRDLACDGERHLRLDFDIERDPRHRKSLVEFELGEATEGSFGEVTFERPEAAELTADSQLDPR